ncbi:pectate lyase family protein [Marinigracilibium pacificum]|nr:T9SS type A sorting domain-containing protein [Marinigracilibium pacificum]
MVLILNVIAVFGNSNINSIINSENRILDEKTTITKSKSAFNASLSARAGNGFVDLSWSVQNMQVYALEVYRDTDADPKGRTRIAIVPSDERNFSDRNVTNGQTYYYWIKVNGSVNSNVAQARPQDDPKVNLNATGDDGFVDLSWNIENPPVTTLEVYRDTDPDPKGRTRIAFVQPNDRSFTDRNVNNGTTYYYWIKANGSINSNISSATPKARPIINLRSNAGSGLVDLSWSIENLTISTLEVYRDTDPDPKGRTRIAVVPASTRNYTDNNVNNGTEYFYWIKVNGSINSNLTSAIPYIGTNELIGYASLNGGTSGGQGGTSVTCGTGDCIIEAINNKKYGSISQPLTIYINGRISPSNTSASKIEIKDVRDISIIGIGTNGLFDGIGIKIYKAGNIIIQNVTIRKVDTGDKDAISIEGPADHIWVDHCELYAEYQGVDKDYYDGLLDAKRDAEYITYSYNYFHDSWKTMLVGSSSSDLHDRKITIHHNYFDNVSSRTPLYRGGQGHIFNNFYSGINSTGINTRAGACLKVENNYFKDSHNPIVWAYENVKGNVDQSGNKFDNVTWGYSDNVNKPGSCQLNIPYQYGNYLNDTDDVPSIVIENTGVGKIGINRDSNTRVMENATIQDISVYPNPVGNNNYINLKIPDFKGNEQIRIVNFSGIEVINRPAKNEVEIIDVSHLPQGQYVIQLKTNTSTKLKLFIK